PRHLFSVLARSSALARPRITSAPDARERPRGLAYLLSVLLRLFGQRVHIVFRRCTRERLLDFADVTIMFLGEPVEVTGSFVERLLDVAGFTFALFTRRPSTTAGLAARVRRSTTAGTEGGIGLPQTRCQVLGSKSSMHVIASTTSPTDPK